MNSVLIHTPIRVHSEQFCHLPGLYLIIEFLNFTNMLDFALRHNVIKLLFSIEHNGGFLALL